MGLVQVAFAPSTVVPTGGTCDPSSELRAVGGTVPGFFGNGWRGKKRAQHDYALGARTGGAHFAFFFVPPPKGPCATAPEDNAARALGGRSIRMKNHATWTREDQCDGNAIAKDDLASSLILSNPNLRAM